MGFDIVGYQPNTARCLRDCVSNQRDLRRTTGHRWREAPCSRRTRGHQSLTEIMFRALKSYIYIYIHINNIYIHTNILNFYTCIHTVCILFMYIYNILSREREGRTSLPMGDV